MRVEIRRGRNSDGVQLLKDGVSVWADSYHIPDRYFVDALREAGAEVVLPQGEFDENGEWMPSV
jgi:hypothetical protein